MLVYVCMYVSMCGELETAYPCVCVCVNSSCELHELAFFNMTKKARYL